MKALFFAIALAAGLGAAPACARDYPGDRYVQAPKGRDGARPERAREGREMRPDRRPDRGDRGDERRERLSDDERRALHRDLDKANRELYQRRNNP
jgi:hypothetical protein